MRLKVTAIMIRLELEQAVFNNIRALVIVGAKAAETGENGVMAAAHILQILAKAAQDSTVAQPKLPLPNSSGHHPENRVNS